jgi:conjugal transfer pilus assembly protein TraE
VVRQGFWVDEAAVSPEYLEQMALFVAQLVYNVTPANAEYNLRLLLQHASPELYGALRQQGEATARRLRADNATTLFAVRAVTHDPSGGRVALHGVLSTYINEKRVAESPRVYRFSFDYRGGRLYVRAIVETSDADPLGARLAREPGA